MSSNFSCEVLENPFGQLVYLRGHLTEAANLPVLKENVKIIVNAEDLTALNSAGTMLWVKWLGNQRRCKSISLRKCKPALVKVFNLVQGSIPENTTVESFFVPYFNEATSEKREVLLQVGTDFKMGEMPKIRAKLETNGKVYELDVTPQTYFAFLNTAPPAKTN
jgi:hypothetical protein